MRIFNSSVKSVLLYSSESWRITKQTVNKIQAFVNRCLRRIVNVKWTDSQQQHFVTKTNQLPVEIEIKRRKLRWTGHTLRKPQSSITRQALTWNPQGKMEKTAKKHLAARHGVESEEDGYLAGNCHHGAAQDPVESFDRWPMLPASRRA